MSNAVDTKPEFQSYAIQAHFKGGSGTAAHPVALALDLGPGDVRGATAGSTPTNTSIVGFLKLFHFFPLQPELVATAHIIPAGHAHVGYQRCYRKLSCYLY